MAEQTISQEFSEIEQLRAHIRTLEQRLSDQELISRTLFDSSPEGLMLTAPDGRIFSANAHLPSSFSLVLVKPATS